jgi:hypothetical protein
MLVSTMRSLSCRIGAAAAAVSLAADPSRILCKSIWCANEKYPGTCRSKVFTM